MTITPDDLVRREVGACVSYLVSTLAQDHGMLDNSDLAELAAQAFELSCPVDDWEEAAFQEGWTETNDGSDGGQHVFTDKNDGQTWCARDWKDLCENFEIEPYQRDIFEHWIVSSWLAEKLEAKGERVDADFAGLCVWGRTTSGQGIASDSVIESICADLNGGAVQ